MNFNKKNIILVLLFLLALIFCKFWLVLVVTIYSLLCLGIVQIKNLVSKKLWRQFIVSTSIFLLMLSVFIGGKLLLFNIFKIPSSSMENQIFPKDVILVNKLKYGPRLPRSPFEIPLVNIGYYFNTNARKRIKQYWWPYKRLSGTTVVKQGDIMVFNSTWDKNFILVKRCVALPGDTLTLKKGRIYTNGEVFLEPSSVKTNIGRYLDVTKANGSSDRNLFFDAWQNWDYNNIGPIVMPIKGMTISLNAKNFAIYKKAIQLGEKKAIKYQDGEYYINNTKKDTYTFEHNYYFMMGDNRDQTEDSRAWGFLPEENIIGKVDRVLFSNYGGSFNWERFFKKVY